MAYAPEVEAQIVERVKLIDAIRASSMPDKDAAIARVEAEIKAIKADHGPRHVIGVYGGPV